MTGIMSRRGFWKISLDELAAAFDEGRGKRSFKLSALVLLPDDDLGRLIPAIVDASRVAAEEHHFVVRWPDGRTEALFDRHSMGEDIWSRMDGRSTLRQIAHALAVEWNDTDAAAFARVRGVFLRLIRTQICRPLNPLE
jgi:hypothetical protein